MYALEILKALNDPDNPAKPKGLNATYSARPRYQAFEITISHSDKHDGMVTITGYEPDPRGGFTVSLDDFRKALEDAGYEFYEARM